MTTPVFVLFYALMMANAAVFSALGQGGGVLYTPIQIFFGIDFHMAAATTLFLIMVSSLSSTLIFRGARRVDWGMAVVLETATMTGAFLGGAVSGYFSASVLTYVFSGVLAFAAGFMVHSVIRGRNCEAATSSFSQWVRETHQGRYCINLFIALPLSLLAGAVSGLVGVAGGVLKVPMLVLLFGVPMEMAVGSSAFMVGLTALGGFAGHIVAGNFDWRLAVALAPGVFIGGQLGARWAVGVAGARMHRIFGYFLILLAVFLVISTAMRV